MATVQLRVDRVQTFNGPGPGPGGLRGSRELGSTHNFSLKTKYHSDVCLCVCSEISLAVLGVCVFVPVSQSHTGVFLQCELGAARFRVTLQTGDQLFRMFIFPDARFVILVVFPILF